MASIETLDATASAAAASIETARGDIQGNILRAYGFPYARYEILRIVDAAGARRLLRRVLERGLITTADTWDPASKPDTTLNVFVSWPGLVALGVAQASLDSFPEEFRQGMPARASILGDTGPNAPSTWEFGNDPDRTHVFFALYGRTAEARERLLASLRAELAEVGAAVEVTHQLDAQMLGNHREHFGFMDGIGQPAIEGSGNEEYPGDGTPIDRRGGSGAWAPLKAGEFVLGWPGETGFPPPAPQPDVLAKNGSFLVYRKLRQDVAAFRAFLREQSQRLWGADAGALGVERLASKLVGRWRSGCPVMHAPLVDNPAMATRLGAQQRFPLRGRSARRGLSVRLAHPPHESARRAHRSRRHARAHASHRAARPAVWVVARRRRRRRTTVRSAAWRSWPSTRASSISSNFCSRSGCTTASSRGWRAAMSIRSRASRATVRASAFRHRTPAPKNVFDLPRFITLRGGGYFFIPSVTALHYIAGQD